ncbi:MAG: hypothetical protein Q4E83_06545 [bacterium]|nr:hypothetical protein [bacterium]
MKRILIIFLAIILTLPVNAAFWNKKDKALELECEGKGYAGTLPDIKSKFAPKEQKITTPIFEAEKDFKDSSKLKPVPKDNPAFLNIIQKKDKTSEYVNDANEIISIMEKLVDCIEDEGTVQLFVTRANVLSMNLDNLAEKYASQPEGNYLSFKKMMQVNSYVKSISQLRKEAQIYQRYLAYQTTGSIYNPENINEQLQYLLEELNSTIIMLKAEKE